MTQSLFHTYQRYKTLQTDKITVLPIVILMPHSACNCRCVMCDIWKDNKNAKQLTENDVIQLLATLKKFGTQRVVMSGGEALLNQNFFRFCEILQQQKIKISLLSTGLLLKRNAENLLKWVGDIVVSLDGDELVHNKIRNTPDAFNQLKEGVKHLHSINPDYKIIGRSVIHRLNFRTWPNIIKSAIDIGLKQISFLPADLSSHAFNRQQAWDTIKQNEIALEKNELPELQAIVNEIISESDYLFKTGFIAESPEKIQKIHTYYSAFYGLNPYPFKKCNAPWVSTVIEADGTVRPCFFHHAIGNIHSHSLENILNDGKAIVFRKKLDMDNDEICKKCVCYLNLPPRMSLT